MDKDIVNDWIDTRMDIMIQIQSEERDSWRDKWFNWKEGREIKQMWRGWKCTEDKNLC